MLNICSRSSNIQVVTFGRGAWLLIASKINVDIGYYAADNATHIRSVVATANVHEVVPAVTAAISFGTMVTSTSAALLGVIFVMIKASER